MLNPILAAAAMVGSSLFVVGNSLRLAPSPQTAFVKTAGQDDAGPSSSRRIVGEPRRIADVASLQLGQQPMWELGFVFVSGALGSAHCIGMCGPFAIAIGAGSDNWKHNGVRQMTYTLGRVCTYAFLGALAGYGGWSLAERTPWLQRAPAVLAIVAGVFLIVQGLFTLGWLRWPSRWRKGNPKGTVAPPRRCLASSSDSRACRVCSWRGWRRASCPAAWSMPSWPWPPDQPMSWADRC